MKKVNKKIGNKRSKTVVPILNEEVFDEETLDLNFIMDITGSMSSWITRAKDTLQ